MNTIEKLHRGSLILVQTDHPFASPFRNKGVEVMSFKLDRLLKSSSWRRVFFLVDCFSPVPHLLAELEPPGQWRWTWRVCLFFSPLPKLHSEIPHPPLFPRLSPEAFCSRLVSSKGGCDCGACEVLPVMVHKTFLRRKETEGMSHPAAPLSSLLPAFLQEGLGQEDRLRDAWGLQRLFCPSHSGLAPAPSMLLPHHPLAPKVPSRICEQMKRIKKVGCWWVGVGGGEGLYL